MSRKNKLTTGEFYHVYNRGVDRRVIFNDGKEYDRFVALLYLCNSSLPVELHKVEKNWSLTEALTTNRLDTLVDIGAYCLMPNHFHILLKEKIDGGISLFMKKISNGFTGYFNIKHHRTGSLFEGTFKSQYVNNDNYLKYLFAYIHLNPVGIIDLGWKEKKIADKARACEFLNTYSYSSIHEYKGVKRQESVILNRAAFPHYFESTSDFNSLLKDWMIDER